MRAFVNAFLTHKESVANLDNSKLNDWLQLAASVGVILSLIFVGLEIKQSREIAIADIYQQRTAILIDEGLPTPGVLGVYCSGLGPTPAGDSRFFGQLAVQNVPSGLPSRGGTRPAGPTYYTGVDRNQFIVRPTIDESLLARFPPTIFFVATRDFAMSGAAYSHRKLLKAGVESDLLIYDGLYHGFMTNPDFPESREAYELTAAFFDKHLGR